MRQLLYILLILFYSSSWAQVNLDSLWKVWNNPSQTDTNRLKAIYDIAYDGYLYSQPDSAFYFSQLQYDFAKKKNLKKYQGKALNTQGAAFYINGNLTKAIEYYSGSLKISQEIRDEKGMAGSLNNIGTIYQQQGNFTKSIEYFTRSLRIYDKLNDSSSIGDLYNNIGAVYDIQGDRIKALEYFSKGFRISEKAGNKQGEETALMNIGIIYSEQHNNVKAIDCFNRSLKIAEEIGDDQGVSSILINIGATYNDEKEYTKALECFTRCLNISESMGDKQMVSTSLLNIGTSYYFQRDYAKSLNYMKKALKIAQETDDLLNIINTSKFLFECYKNIGDYKYALEMYELHIFLKDSLISEKNQKEVMKQEMQYTFEKQKALDSKEHEKEMAVSNEKEKKQRVISYSVALGLLLVLLFSMFVIKRLRITRKQKRIIELQKEIVDEKQREIVDSITYAKRLQEAILPSNHFVKKHLPSSFIIYNPKDIVAGDFYWMERVGLKSGIKKSEEDTELILLAAADCTGHGVPGAMVSVVCSNALNRSVFEFDIKEPGEILDKTRELVLETFSKSNTDVKDGMDISLVSIFKKANQELTTIKWAGANNPLWYVSNGTINEIKANKQPIGKMDNPQPFTTHTIELKKGDIFFLFTDGYADQFGGEKGKKFKYKQLEQMLIANINLTMDEQKQLLNKTIKAWQGGLQQVDDILVIGVQV